MLNKTDTKDILVLSGAQRSTWGRSLPLSQRKAPYYIPSKAGRTVRMQQSALTTVAGCRDSTNASSTIWPAERSHTSAMIGIAGASRC